VNTKGESRKTSGPHASHETLQTSTSSVPIAAGANQLTGRKIPISGDIEIIELSLLNKNVPLCRPYFSQLLQCTWSTFGVPAGSVDPRLIIIESYEAKILWKPLSMRLFSISLSLEWEQIFRKELESSENEVHATQFANSKLVLDTCSPKYKGRPLNDEEIGIVIRNQDDRRKCGDRWRQLIELVDSPEILLIMGTEDELEEDMIDISRVVADGDDDEFAAVKELLLQDELGFGKVCHLLSGTTEMIQRLGGLVQESDLRQFLIHSINQRVLHALGPLETDLKGSGYEDEDSSEEDGEAGNERNNEAVGQAEEKNNE
jgi:hypothetical protein